MFRFYSVIQTSQKIWNILKSYKELKDIHRTTKDKIIAVNNAIITCQIVISNNTMYELSVKFF